MAAQEQATVTSTTVSLAKWTSYLTALVGLWVLVSPFVLTGAITEGTVMWSNVVAGVLIVVLGAFSAYELRTADEMPAGTGGEYTSWIAALAGLYVLVTPFVLTGAITEGTALYSNVVAGLIALVLAGYAGYFVQSRE